MTKIKEDISVLSEVNMSTNKNTTTTTNTTLIKMKRGRKSKKEIQSILDGTLNTPFQENIVCNSEEESMNTINNTVNTNDDANTNQVDILNCGATSKFYEEDDDDENMVSNNNQKIVSKKRGRKPKGGKIIQQMVPSNNNKEVKPNVILHLKCSLKDLQLNSINSSVESFHFSTSKNELNYEIIHSDNNKYAIENNSSSNAVPLNDEDYQYDNNDYEETYSNKETEMKDIWKKLKTLENNLHINNISDKKSACFWCTYEFDNPPVYVPKHYIKETYSVYGCFCSPECATAYLMEENIDSSSKFERYYLLNHIYSKIYNYDKNIKPAPNPFYMLDKYYGNLTIQEYRALLRNERLFLIVDKPLTRILPELHEDNDDFIINNKIIPTNKYKIKKKIKKKNQNKNKIIKKKFKIK